MPRDKYKASTIYARYATAGNKVCHNFVTFRKKIITCRFFWNFCLVKCTNNFFFSGTPDRTMCPEVDSVSESEYQGFLLGLRGPVRLADDLPPL